jgi:glucose-6-phosphate isomerase
MKAEAFAALEDLRAHRAELGNPHLRDLFAGDPERFSRFSLSIGDLTLDYSKNRIVAETMPLLSALAEAAGLAPMRDAMFSGEALNFTENRAVGHVALRAPRDAVFTVDGRNVVPDVHDVLNRFCDFAEHIRTGETRGFAADRFTDVVNIGIGGSDLGPAMAVAALTPYRGDGPRVHFVSNVDGAHLSDTLATLDAERTLFIIASKTFTTSETMTNAASARAWLAYRLGEEGSATISPRYRPTWRRLQSSGSSRNGSSGSGTGLAGVTRCGRLSACRWRFRSAPKTSAPF